MRKISIYKKYPLANDKGAYLSFRFAPYGRLIYRSLQKAPISKINLNYAILLECIANTIITGFFRDKICSIL